MANGTIAFDTLSTSGQIDGTARSIDTDFLLNGCSKSWALNAVDASSDDSFNASSGTDNGTGDYTIAISNDMANATYSMGGMSIKAYQMDVTNPGFDEDATDANVTEIALGLAF